MGLFSKKPKNPDEGLPTVEESPVDLSGVDLSTMLDRSSDDRPDYLRDMAWTFIKLQNFRELNGDAWSGVAYLVPGDYRGKPVIWVRAQGNFVDRLTRRAYDQVKETVTAPTPVHCTVSVWGSSGYRYPRVECSVPKSKAKPAPPPPT